MSKRFTFLTVALSALVAFLVGLIIAGEFTPSTIVVTQDGTNLVVAERMNAAVVNIDSMAKGDTREPQRYFRRGDGPIEGPSSRDLDIPRQGAGSGFIIDREGYILTNHHVIDAAERITVTLADGRTFRAEVAGTDPAIDVALLKIAGTHDLPEPTNEIHAF